MPGRVVLVAHGAHLDEPGDVAWRANARPDRDPSRRLARSSSTPARPAPTRQRRSGRAWRRPRSRSGSAGETRDLAAPLGRRRGDRDRHREERRRARPDPPRRRPRDGDGGLRALAGDEGLDRPADRERLLLRLRVPRGRLGLRRRPRGDRGEDARAHRRRRGLRAHRHPASPRRSSASAARTSPTRSS